MTPTELQVNPLKDPSRNITRSLQTLLCFIAGAILATTLGCDDSVGGRPTPEEVQPALVHFLKTDFGHYDNLSFKSRPENIRLGNYNKNNKGWPVYADYEAVYTTNGMKMHRNSIAKLGMPMCYAIVADGKVFCYKSKMEKNMEGMLDDMKEFAGKNHGRMSKEDQRKMMREMQAKMQKSMQKIDKKELEDAAWDSFKDFSPRF